MSNFVQQGDGTTASSGSATAVSTGTGGTALGNVTAGNILHVIYLAVGRSVSYSCTLSFAGTATLGTPVQIRHVDETATNNLEWYEFYVPITGSGSCTVTATYGQAYTRFSIYVAELHGLASTPFTSGEIGYETATATGTTGTQSSSNTPTLAESSAMLCGFSYTTNLTSPSSAGSGFTGETSLWSGLGAACCTYETKQLSSNAAVAATFVPANYVTVYTLATVFANPPAGAALAGAANDATSAAANLNTPLAGAATDTTSASATLNPPINLLGAATDTTSAAGALTNWATVTLAGTLYTGAGGALDPNFWTGGNIPVLGDTLYYDPTYITIEPNAEIVSTSNNCSAVVQFNDGTGWALGLIVITPYMVGYASDTTSAVGLLNAGSQLVAAASSLTSAVAALTVNINLVSAASDVTTAIGNLITSINLSGGALDTTSAAGQVTVGLGASASDATAGAGALTVASRLSSAAASVTSAVANLVTSINLVAGATDATAASGALQAVVILSGLAADVTSATANLFAAVSLAAAAGDTTSAAGAIIMGLSPTFGLTRFVISRPYLRPFRVSALTNKYRFDEIEPGEAVPLTFDFSVDLPAGVTLNGIQSVTYQTVAGTDPNPSAIANGPYGVDVTQMFAIVPVKVVNDGCDYLITVTAATTDSYLVLVLKGVLPVRS